jgi:hypothetical protein
MAMDAPSDEIFVRIWSGRDVEWTPDNSEAITMDVVKIESGQARQDSQGRSVWLHWRL